MKASSGTRLKENRMESNFFFFNISQDDLTLFEWKPPHIFKSFILDMNIIRGEQTYEDYFFHHDKGNVKIVYTKKNGYIYAIGAKNYVQLQYLEALLETLIEKFHEVYDVDTILSYSAINPSIFKGFKPDVEAIINNFNNLNLIKTIRVMCKVCKKVFPLTIKKSLIENSEKFPISVIYNHNGHSLICYIEKNFTARGTFPVNFAG